MIGNDPFVFIDKREKIYTKNEVIKMFEEVLIKMDGFKHDESTLEPMDGDWSSYQENLFIDKLEDIIIEKIKEIEYGEKSQVSGY